LNSASKISREQFLLLRTIYEKNQTSAFNSARFGNLQEYQTAKQLLQASTDFQSYLTSIRTGTITATGAFHMIPEQQKEVLELTSNSANMLRRKDKTPINTTFITLLQAISRCDPTRTSRWRFSKLQFIANFGRVRSGGRRLFKAVTDGQLQALANDRIIATVECKLNRRRVGTASTLRTEMQEAAQVVAWIKQFPGSNRRALVAQDDEEIYVTFAEYNNGWLDYIKRSHVQANGLMTMVQYGPWDLKSAVLPLT
jgi:hypothetical protein